MKTYLLNTYRKLKKSHEEQKKEWGTYGMIGLIFMILLDIIYILSDKQLIPKMFNNFNFYLYIIAFFFLLLFFYKYDKNL